MPVDGHDVAAVQLGTAAVLGGPVDRHEAVLEQLPGVHAVLGEVRELEELTDPDRFLTDRHVLRGRHGPILRVVASCGVGDHYFSSTPSVASRPGSVRLHTPGVDLELTTDTGVFSQGRIDRGTKVLLDAAPMPPVRGPLLDIGCGYGPIALTLAARRRRLPVWGVDLNERALGLTRANADAAGLGNVTACLPDDVPADLMFAGVYSNPPIRSGKPALHELLLRWLPRLMPGGRAYLVIAKNLGSDSLHRWLEQEQGFPTSRLVSEKGYRVLEVAPRPA